jgi:hypothetical protein
MAFLGCVRHIPFDQFRRVFGKNRKNGTPQEVLNKVILLLEKQTPPFQKKEEQRRDDGERKDSSIIINLAYLLYIQLIK